MSWFNRLLGGGLGFFLGGPVGSMIGLTIGHMFDKRRESAAARRFLDSTDDMQIAESTHFVALFSLLSKVAKGDGRISQREGQYFLELLDEMDLEEAQREFAIAIFNKAKDSPHSHREFARQLRQVAPQVALQRGFRNGEALLQNHFYVLLSMAAVDGGISRAEDLLLRQIAAVFGCDEHFILQAFREFQFAEANEQTDDQDAAYKVLDLLPQASDDEVRNAYRRLAKEHHPDKLAHRELPPAARARAERRFRQIQNAWEQIRKERGLS